MRVLDFGHWTSHDGRRYLLSWDAESGWLNLDADHIARIRDETRLRNALLGWESHVDGPNSVKWLAGRLDAVR